MTTPSLKSSHAPAPRWTREQIREARRVAIVPLLLRRGLALREREAANYEIVDYPGLIVKDSYWRWPERNLSGNAIDLFVRVVGMSFHDAMREIIRR